MVNLMFLPCVVLLLRYNDKVSRSILEEVQTKLYEHGISSVIHYGWEIKSYTDCYCLIYEISPVPRITPPDNKIASMVEIHVLRNKHFVNFQFQIWDSNQLFFKGNSIFVCPDKHRCGKYSFNAIKKSLKGVPFFGNEFHLKFMNTSDTALRKKVPFEQLLQLLQERLKFRLKVFRTHDPEEAKQYSQMSGTGNPNFIDNRALCAKDYSIPHAATAILNCNVALIFVVRSPKREPKYTAFLTPFENQVWLWLFITFIVNGITLYGIASVESKMNCKKKLSLGEIFWLKIKIVFNQDVNMDVFPGPISNAVSLIWMLLAFVITSAYFGLISSALARLRHDWVPSTYEELTEAVKQGVYSIGTVKGGHLLRLAMGTSFTLLEDIEPLVNEFSIRVHLKNESNWANDLTHGLEKVLSSNYALMMRENVYLLKLTVMEKKMFRTIDFGERAISKCTNLMIRAKSPYVPEITMMVQRIVETGIYNKFVLQEYEHFHRKDKMYSSEAKRTDRPLTMQDLKLPLYVLIVGHFLATVVFIIELLFGKTFKI